jgi:peptidoglycan/LPS O-acetylase OafA/YrhL
MKQSHELAGIEILRFFCAFGVLIWHYQHFFFLGAWDSAVGQALRPSLPLYHALSVFYDNGSLAVPFFWVISGFIFYWHYSEPVRNRAVKFADFLVRRFSRLYPLHFVTLIFVAVGQYIYYRSHQTTFIYLWNKPIWFASQLLFASNWFTRQPVTFNGPIWSVSIEILIYLSFFFIARTFRPSALVAVCVAAAFSICFNFLHSFIHPDVFACGMYFFGGGVAQRLAMRPAALPIAGCAAVAMLAALTFGLYRVNSASVLLLATSSVIVFTRLGETVFGVPFRCFAFLGNATYSSYLLHFPLQLFMVIVVDAIGWERNIFYSPIIFLAFLSLVVGLSLVVHRYFEMPAQNFIRVGAKFSFRRSSAAAAE